MKNNYEKYELVQKFPIVKAYLEHFERTSMDNSIPGLLSFFFVQGQIAVQYTRIPTGDSYIDPRVHVFWIQPSRSGKSIAWNFVGDILSKVDIPHTMYTTGTDAGLVGSGTPWNQVRVKTRRMRRSRKRGCLRDAKHSTLMRVVSFSTPVSSVKKLFSIYRVHVIPWVRRTINSSST